MSELRDINTLEETAAYLRITERLLRSLATQHKIGYLKQGRAYSFPRSAVEAYVASNTAPVVQAHPFGLTNRSARRLSRDRNPNARKS